MGRNPEPLIVEPLTEDAFAPFGEIITMDDTRSVQINEGRTQRFDTPAKPDVGVDGTVMVSIFRGTPVPPPIRIRMLERHPLGSQAFVPMERHPWLVVVAERPEPDACRAFLARGDQGLQYAPGVWHHPLLTLQPVQDFLVIDRAAAQDDGAENLEEHWFDEPNWPLVGHL